METETPFVNLRNIISGVAQAYPAKEAEQWLSHPVFGKNLEVVRTDKPEVLADRTKADLLAEIELRNAGRNEADLISDKGNRDVLIAALAADDKKGNAPEVVDPEDLNGITN